MREILFKAKRKDNGEWVEGYYLKYIKPSNGEIEHRIFVSDGDGVTWYTVTEDTLCQYTGLTDKNGKKIWENDILFDDDVYSLVRWDEEEARFVIDDYGTKGCLMEYGWDEDAGRYDVVDTNGFDDFTTPVSDFLKVVGNKFDHPELMKGEEHDT